MMSRATFRVRCVAILLLATAFCSKMWGQETDHRRGPQTATGWGFFPDEHRDPALPNVLLMGDSILGGYKPVVVQALRGKANVDVFLNPFHQASPELYPQLGAALSQGTAYAVIHFNMGLHGWDKGRIPEGQFEPLTRKLVEFLKAHAPTAQLIWASTTPVTDKGRPGTLNAAINPIIVEQNRLAAQIMAEAGVPIDDLYGLMLGRLNLARGDQFHWVPAGSKIQGLAVAEAVLQRIRGASTAPLSLFVSPVGNDDNDGSAEHPFLTLERARAAVRSIRQHPAPAQTGRGVTVNLRGGIYLREAPFELGAADSGQPQAPVQYRSYPGEIARLVGGKKLLPAWFERVGAQSPVWSRLQTGARGQVLEISLPDHGISQYGSFAERGIHLYAPGALALYVNSHPLPLAQWPKASSAPLQALGIGFERTGKVLSPASFVVPGNEASRWSTADQAWFHGYWGNLWADFHLPAAAIDASSQTVTLAHAPHFGLKPGQPFRIYNLLEEITAPGDWFLDRKTGKLYVWPTPDWERAEIFVSTLPGEVISLRNTHDIVLDRLTVEIGWSRLVKISGGNHNSVRDCVLRNAGTDGAIIDGTDNGISDSRIEDVGDCAVRLEGGSRAGLVPGGNYVRNCRISHFSEWTWTYAPGIEIHGDGQIVANNLLTDGPHSAILFFGNNHRIEYNDIHDVCLFSSDAGAVYAGRHWDYRGTKIAYNFIHDLHSPLEGPGIGDNGVYLDDCLSGILVVGNILYNITGDAILSNGGRDNIMEGNLIVQCGTALETTGFGTKHATTKPGDSWNLIERLSDDGVSYRTEPWASAYPALAAIPDNWAAVRAPGALWLYPEGCRFDHNLAYGNHVLIRRVRPGDLAIIARVVEVKDNVDERQNPFADESALVAALKSHAASVRIAGAPPIPFEAIGPQGAGNAR